MADPVPPASGVTYRSAGVDIDAGDHAVDLIRPLVASTHRPEVVGGIGGFGGVFAVPAGYREPLLVAATDGVGTKLEIARAVGRLDTIGIDLVAMCVDDLVCQGAEPLFFLDYYVTERLDPSAVESVVAGIASGCRMAGCALLGGEMAEHPGTMPVGSFDLAGFAVGVVERSRVLDGSAVEAGDLLVGLPSPGLRSNGFSLVRSLVADLDLSRPAWPGGQSLGAELLTPSVIYARSVLSVLGTGSVHGVAHITGGGLPGNVPRILGPGLAAAIDRSTWTPPPVFAFLAQYVADEEMLRVFNMGIGMVLAVPPSSVDAVLASLPSATVIGAVIAGSGGVQFR